MPEARRNVWAAVPVLTVVLVVGGIAQFLLVARGSYLLTAHFAPDELAQVPGQTLQQIHERGLAAIILAVIPFAAALLALLSHRLFKPGWAGFASRAALWMACADVLVILAALLTTS